jgi:glycosyltransferase involved in cell wall biosynthesis
MKILCIAYCYPPLQYPATMCYVKLVAGLKAHGVDVEVVTVDPDTFYFPGGKAIDPSMMRIVPEEVKNHRISSWEGNPMVTRLRENSIAHRVLYRFFEPRKREWTFPALRYLKKLDLACYDAILTFSQPHCNHLVGLELKRLTGKPWVAYLSDPWTDMPWSEYSSRRIGNYNLKLERQVITLADKVLFTSQETVDLVMQKYSTVLRRKCGVLPHAFVPEWFSLVDLPKIEGREGHLEILHTGHFYGERSPLPVFLALKQLKAERPLAGSCHFTFLGSMTEEHRRSVIEMGLDGIVSIRGTVPYLESLALMLRSDYLLLVDAPLRLLSESVFLPSKLVDYIGSKKPIIGITPAIGTAARVLQETGNIVRDVADSEEIYRVFADMLLGKLRTSPVSDHVNKYHYLETSKNLIDFIKSAASESNNMP